MSLAQQLQDYFDGPLSDANLSQKLKVVRQISLSLAGKVKPNVFRVRSSTLCRGTEILLWDEDDEDDEETDFEVSRKQS